MKLKNIAPWNWFKHEEAEEPRRLPARYEGADSAHPLGSLHRELDRIFDDWWERGGFSPRSFLGTDGFLRPTVDISESDDRYTIRVEVPGVEKNDVKVDVQDDRLIVRGEKKREHEDKDENYHRVEQSYGSFQRVLTLPPDADPEDVKAKCRNGVLTLTVKRTEEPSSSGRRIEVN